MSNDGLRGRRILVVEDESLILLTIQDIIEELGCELAGAAMRADRAIAIIREGAVDAALLDVNLGNGRTSYPVADELAERGIPFAFVTGYGAGVVSAAHRDRAVLSKPVEQRSLEATLRAMLCPEAAPVAGVRQPDSAPGQAG